MNSGLLRANPASVRAGIELGASLPPDYNSSALTARPRYLPHLVIEFSECVFAFTLER